MQLRPGKLGFLGTSALLGGLVGAGAVILSRFGASGQSRQVHTAIGSPAEPSADGTPTPDDLDKEQLDQLHAATLKASDSCFELKKLCATVLVPAGTLVSVFTDKRLNSAVFVAGLLIITTFWLADAVGYYYQRKLRSVMKEIWERRAARCTEGYNHVPRGKKVNWLHAAINTSMIYYLILAMVLGITFTAYSSGLIASIPGRPQ